MPSEPTRLLWISRKILYLCCRLGVRPGKTRNSRDNDIKSTHTSYKLNKSQLLSGKGSRRSQPKSGNDNVRAGAATKSPRNASGVARPSSGYRKNGLKCVQSCTTGQALTQNRPIMRQDLHDRAGVDAKSPRNASGLACPGSGYRKNGLKCVRTCMTVQALPQNRPKMRQDLHTEILTKNGSPGRSRRKRIYAPGAYSIFISSRV